MKNFIVLVILGFLFSFAGCYTEVTVRDTTPVTYHWWSYPYYQYRPIVPPMHYFDYRYYRMHPSYERYEIVKPNIKKNIKPRNFGSHRK